MQQRNHDLYVKNAFKSLAAWLFHRRPTNVRIRGVHGTLYTQKTDRQIHLD